MIALWGQTVEFLNVTNGGMQCNHCVLLQMSSTYQWLVSTTLYHNHEKRWLLGHRLISK